MGDGQYLRLGLLIEVYCLNRSSLILCEENLFQFSALWVPAIVGYHTYKVIINLKNTHCLSSSEAIVQQCIFHKASYLVRNCPPVWEV